MVMVDTPIGVIAGILFTDQAQTMTQAEVLAVVQTTVPVVATLMTCLTRNVHGQRDLSMPDLMFQTFCLPDSAWIIALTGCTLDATAPNLSEIAQGISGSKTPVIAMISKQSSATW